MLYIFTIYIYSDIQCTEEAEHAYEKLRMLSWHTMMFKVMGKTGQQKRVLKPKEFLHWFWASRIQASE